ncbi:hypothetical protein [Haliangium sp.]|uniref:hypothetical protein n=1 Tax=Haliangium sp. TaxID=2663208 RepID=UPI003D0A76FF
MRTAAWTSPRTSAPTSGRRATLALIASAALLATGCPGKDPGAGAQTPASPGESSQATPGSDPATPSAPTPGDDTDMSTADNHLSRINELLTQHPATEQICGDKRSTLAVEGDQVTLDSTWSKCPGTDRSTVSIDKLDPAGMRTEMAPEYGQARLFVPCKGDEACSGRYTMREGESEWEHIRDEAVFAIDCAPTEDALASLKDLVGQWLAAAQSR